MKDFTVGEFCEKFEACKVGREWAFALTESRDKAMMSEIWPHLNFGNYLGWVITREGVFSDKELRIFACRCVRETPLTDGRKVWDLLTDDRSKNAVIVAEQYASGIATKNDLAAASDAAWDAAWDAASDAARAAASDAARAAASDAARVAASDAARDAARAAARDAARAAAMAAARDAARAAASDAQKSFLTNPFEKETK